MAKRKRDDYEQAGGRLDEKVAQWETELSRALKQAKGFERQRLSKRIRDSPDKVERLQREVVVLKSLDLPSVARAHLCSSLLKIKGVAESPKLPASIRPVQKPVIDEDERAALHNVTSALCNRKNVRDIVDKAVIGVCMALKVPMPDKNLKKGKAARKEQEGQPDERQKGGTKSDGAAKSAGSKDDSDEMSWGGVSDDDNDGVQDSRVTSYAQTKAEDWSGGSEEEFNSEEELQSETDSEDDYDQIPKSKSRRAAPAATAASSMFLPSLMGGYIDNSDSDASDIEVGPTFKRNRRGQRARQAIWEKKYGEKAKHKVKQSRDDGWDLRKGAVATDEGQGRPWKKGIKTPFEKKRYSENGAGQNTSHNYELRAEPAPQAKPKPKPVDAGPLHPSWIAAQKKKEQATASFQGKKIVF